MTTLRRFTFRAGPPVLIDGGLGRGEVALVDGSDARAGALWGRVEDGAAGRAAIRAAALAFVATAHGAVDAVAGVAPPDIGVVGDGVLAGLVRRLLSAEGAPVAPPAAPGSTTERRPRAMIEAGGTARTLAQALASVATGGTVVLAAEPEEPCLEARTYADIHLRGVTVLGPAVGRAGPGDEDATAWAIAGLVDAELGAPSASGLWYRVSVPSRQ